MIILLMIICIGLFVLGILMQNLTFFIIKDMEAGGFYLSATCVAFCIIFAIIAIIMGIYVSGLNVIDSKITMYDDENKVIESQIDELVKQYMDYETGTLKEFESDDSIALVSLYPELKSDTLVKSQISVYVSNNEKIKRLKEQKIDGSVYKWWLYFGH